jgi:hypothetical protein
MREDNKQIFINLLEVCIILQAHNFLGPEKAEVIYKELPTKFKRRFSIETIKYLQRQAVTFSPILNKTFKKIQKKKEERRKRREAERKRQAKHQ